MKALFAFSCIFTALPAAAAETSVLLRLETSISTRTAQVGDAVHLRTARPVSAGGLSIPSGSYARGVITRSQRAGRVHGRAELEIRLDSIVLADGTMLPVTGTSEIRPARKIREYHEVDLPKLPFAVGIAAGYGGALIASTRSNSEETIVNAGALAGVGVGVTTGILMAVLKRGEDLDLRPGTEIEGVLETR